MPLQTSNYLRDCVVKAIILLELTPCGHPFSEEEIKFFNTLYLWRRPEKFFKNDNEAKIVSGTTALWFGEQKCLQFVFDNGYTWMASVTKLNKSAIKECKKIARTRLVSMKRLLGKDERVATPLGPGVVNYVRMKSPDFSAAESYSVLLDSYTKAVPPFRSYVGTIFPADDVKAEEY